MTAVLIDEHVHEKVFNDSIAELLSINQEKLGCWTNSFYRTMSHAPF
jgi:hypothetical protein